MNNVPNFIKSEWFMLLFMILFAPVGIALLFYFHNDKYGNVLKITICILSTMVLISRCTPAKVVEKRVEVDKPMVTVNVTKTVTEIVTVTPEPTLTEEEQIAYDKKQDEQIKENDKRLAEAEKENPLIKGMQERPMMNGIGTERIGTYSRSLGVKELLTDDVLIEFDKYINSKDFKYSFIDFNDGTGIHIVGAMYSYCKITKGNNNDYNFGETISYLIVDSENNKVDRSNYK